MKIMNGVYASAKVFTTDNPARMIDDYAAAQIQMICDNEVAKNSKIRVMPDVHPGKVGTIGLTMTIADQIMPNLIGIDIGCGMTMAKIKGKKIEYEKLDKVIRENVPAGFAIRKQPHHRSVEFDVEELICYKHIRKEKTSLSLGTLGGGNHFIEVDKDGEGNVYLLIHSGSRHLGKKVTEFYLKEGQKYLEGKGIVIPYELTYLEGALMEEYLHDLQVVQKFAALNREIMIDVICKGMKWKVEELFSCIHNYVDFTNDTPILRKGAVSARAGERVIIPMNMKDGVILGTGRGNPEWNYSAPHGAGRILKREDVSSKFTVSAYKAEMKGIYSSCINKDTLDEAPFAYRRLEDMAEIIGETVTIDKILKPVYNFKAGSRK